VSIDTAFTENKENDPSALTVWGVFEHGGFSKAILMEARRLWKPLYTGQDQPKRAEESLDAFIERAGLVAIILETVWRRTRENNVGATILIEREGRGIDATNEVRRLLQPGRVNVEMFRAAKHGDKTARLIATSPLFASEMIFAPDRGWADMVIDEVGQFPKGRHDDLVDTVSMALIWLRANRLIAMPVEVEEEKRWRESYFPDFRNETIAERYGA
jgi:predicted phage terminase large subunit-like protein